jgi:hypothetical protein
MTDARTITRRRLLTYGGAATVTAMLPAGVARAAGKPAASAATSTNWLERGAFSSRVGQRFSMATPSGAVALTLAKVSDLNGKTSKGKSLAGRNDAFLLTFKGAGSATAESAARVLSHAQLGSKSLFVVPGSGVYTVLVNRSE